MNLSDKKVKIVIDDVEYLVEVGDLEQSPVAVTVNGKQYKVAWEVLADKPAIRSVVPAAPTVSAPPPPAPAPRPVTAAAGNEVTAPMPGNILQILVKVGERVEPGQPLCYLEAMKMKNAIRSPRAGTIASVNAQEGQTVAYGTLLFTFE